MQLDICCSQRQKSLRIASECAIFRLLFASLKWCGPFFVCCRLKVIGKATLTATLHHAACLASLTNWLCRIFVFHQLSMSHVWFCSIQIGFCCELARQKLVCLLLGFCSISWIRMRRRAFRLFRLVFFVYFPWYVCLPVAGVIVSPLIAYCATIFVVDQVYKFNTRHTNAKWKMMTTTKNPVGYHSMDTMGASIFALCLLCCALTLFSSYRFRSIDTQCASRLCFCRWPNRIRHLSLSSDGKVFEAILLYLCCGNWSAAVGKQHKNSVESDEGKKCINGIQSEPNK